MRVRAVVALLFSLLLVAVSQAQTQPETVLYSFGASPDGGLPYNAPIQASDGNFYGVTQFGGSANGGTVYRITPSGQETVIYNFCSQTNCNDGDNPVSLIQGTDGYLYGNCVSGGSSQYYGTIFKLSLSGAFTLLHTNTPAAPYYGAGVSIVEGSDGNFYGGLSSGSVKGGIYRLTPGGTYSILYGDQNGGLDAYTYLTEASDGGLYGFSVSGGANGAGYVFRATLDGGFEDVYDFCSVKNCADGVSTNFAYNLFEGSDGALYGATSEGGVPLDGSTYGEGVVFRLTTSPVAESVLYTFCTADANCSDGARPYGTVFLGGNGLIYGNNTGTPYVSSGVNDGDLYSVSQTGTHSVVYYYSASEKTNAGPTQGSDGNIYDAITRGGPADEGEIARFSATDAPVQLSIQPAIINPGQSATMTWSVKNAFSKTMQRCFASGGWNGLKATSGTVTVSAATTTTYGLTCGGIESGFATLTVVQPKTPTTTVLTITPNPVAAGATALLSAKVTPTTGSGTPTGNVTFSTSGTTIATVLLTSGTANYSASTAGLSPGAYSISASYQGDSAFAPSTGSKTATVTGVYPTRTSVTATPNPATRGQTITATATVARTSGGASPTGSVTFSVSGTTLATVTLNGSGVATYAANSSSLGAGIYELTAHYNGDANDATSSSPTTSVVVRNATTLAVTATPNPVTRPASVTLSATVSRMSASGYPGGSVTFAYQGQTLGSATINGSGVAQLTETTGSLGAGTYIITATYAGDATDAAASGSISVTVH